MANNTTDTQKPKPSRVRPLLTSLVALTVVTLTVIAAFVLALGDLPVDIQRLLPTPIAAHTPTTQLPSPSPTATTLRSPTAIPTRAPIVQPPPTLTPLPLSLEFISFQCFAVVMSSRFCNSEFFTVSKTLTFENSGYWPGF